MNILEYIISAKRCLSASKLRTLLTTLGIIVGISSVILINTIGSSLGKTIENIVYSMYSGNEAYISITPEKGTEVEYDDNGFMILPNGVGFSSEILDEYDRQFADKAKRVVINEITDLPCKISISDEMYSSVCLCASSSALKDYNNMKILDGRFITRQDEENKAAAAVISDITAKNCFGNESPVGKQITISGQNGDSFLCTVVGVYKFDDYYNELSMCDDDRDFEVSVYLPYTYVYHELEIEEDEHNYVSYSIKYVDDTEKYKAETKSFFDSYFEGSGWTVYIELMTDQLDVINTVVNAITLIIAAIAAIALFVGGIGVMNIMLVSVTERTMEIGVRKAMGASNKSIRMQFITESVMISILGSILGIILGLIESKLVAIIAVRIANAKNFNLKVDLSIPYIAILGAVVFSFVIGIGFGVYPAQKAANMEVVDALRYE